MITAVCSRARWYTLPNVIRRAASGGAAVRPLDGIDVDGYKDLFWDRSKMSEVSYSRFLDQFRYG